MINLQNKRLHLRVDENVHAEDLKTRLNHVVRWKTRVVIVLEHRQCAENRFDDHIVNVRPKLSHVVALIGKNSIERRNLSLCADLIVG